MSKRDCCDCLFGDMCPAEQTCEWFSPLDDDVIDEYIENARQKFYEDWIRYTTENEE